jgi:uncharacterized lipoprotein YmbA
MPRDDRPSPPRHSLGVLSLGVMILLLTACGTTPASRFYVLIPTLEAETTATSPSMTLGLQPVKLPASVDRSQMVSSISSHQRQLSELDRWAEPLHENVTRVIGQNLEARLGPASVYPLPHRAAPEFQSVVSIEILEFDAVVDGQCSIVARFHIVDGSGLWKTSQLVHAASSGRSGGAAGVAEAMSANLASLCDAIVDRLRSSSTAGSDG